MLFVVLCVFSCLLLSVVCCVVFCCVLRGDVLRVVCCVVLCRGVPVVFCRVRELCVVCDMELR